MCDYRELNARLFGTGCWAIKLASAIELFLLLLIAPSGLAGERRTLQGHVPAAIKRLSLQPVGDLDESKRLNLAIGLPVRDPAGLTNLIAEIYDPQSANYRHYLSPEEFTAKFGASEADYAALVAFATTNGLKITGTYPNRLLLDVNGSVAEIKRALGINLRVYQHPTEARTFFAPDTEPSVDAGGTVLDIAGLDNFVKPHPLYKKLPPGARPTPRFGSAPDGLSYLGNDFRNAYVPGTTLTGAGQIVALFELDGYYASDITAYETAAHQSAVPLTNVLVHGFNGIPVDPGAESEVDLDIEMAIAMAPGLAKVMVYEGPASDIPPNDILAKIAADNAAKQISCSWGFSINSSIDQTFKQYATQGQSFFLASGDTGAFLGAVDPPSDDPYITIVGGTTLSTTGPHGAWVAETTWNWGDEGGGLAASGGGFSTTYALPAWQQGINMSTNLGSATRRNLPDVSLTADGCWVIDDQGHAESIGGTSAAAPLWAGLTALINQQAIAAGKTNVGFLNPALYALAKGTAYPYLFHDITTGNNIPTGTTKKFSAVPGFDLCTGWGTPNGTNLINALAPVVITPLIVSNQFTLADEGCTPPNGAIDPGETVAVNVSLLNIGTRPTSNLVATLVASSAILDPSAAQTYGAITNGGAPVARPFSFTANGTCGQAITAGFQLQDGTNNLGTLNLNFRLGKAVPTNVLSQNFDSVTAPALPSGWSTINSGAQSKWVTATSVHDTAPNAGYASDAANIGVTYLVSPLVAITTPTAQLTFRQEFNLEAFVTNGVVQDGYDGGTLDISVANGAFKDILVAGGSFAVGGYNAIIDGGYGNPLAGRAAWSGVSTGWVTTTVNLPAMTAGQNVKFRWACGTDNGNVYNSGGWYLDTVSVMDGYYRCCEGGTLVTITAEPTNVVAVAGGAASFDVAASGTQPLGYQWFFNNASLAGATNTSLLLANAQPAAAGSYTVVVTNSLNSATSTVATLRVLVPPVVNAGSFSHGTNFSFAINSVPGLNYTLEYNDSLSQTNWIPIPPPVTGTGGTIILQDNNALSVSNRFYRVIVN